MSRRPTGPGNDPRVIPFRPRPKPPKAPLRLGHSLKLFLMLLVGVGLFRALYAGRGLDLYDLLFSVVMAGAITLGDLYARRK